MNDIAPLHLQIPTPIGGPLPTPKIHTSYDAERRERKLRLAAAFRIFSRFGLAEGIAGHITVRDPEHHDRFWVNAYAQHFSSIHPDDLICIDEEGNVHDGSGGPVNAAAVAIHCGIHATHQHVTAAAHTHSIYGRAFSARKRTLLPINQEACLFFDDQAAYQGDVLVLDRNEGRRIAAAMGNRRTAVLVNHGLLTVGTSVDATAYRFLAMERCCQIQLLAEAAGEFIVMTDEEATSIRQQIGSDYVAWLAFQGLLGQLLRESPDLRYYQETIG
ncbi:class II aldolase/adducin family protein [Cupriavidus pauculus]|uniref:Class II aldolase/adducin family protein n=1 Tax=Cupriavidus pauculus TaxID=82633 RepID=A0A5P2H5R6_9BURK|nr:class II aldolase/adducin family protein [Cupriavidus pauculus]QET02853.1 class II aldolase/adducin family protein [Cupriavidus pauculus]